MKYQASSEGGGQPLWVRDGKQLFYRRRDQVWVVDVQTNHSLTTSKPRLLFEKAGYGHGDPIRGCDLSIDGKRFLMVRLAESKSELLTEITLVQNWFEELKRLVPTEKK
jgi:hypothetical protein